MKAMKSVAGRLKLELAQFRELAAFAQFSSDLDPATKSQIERGRRITEILKQPINAPVPVEEQVAVIWAATSGHMDEIEVERCQEFETGYIKFLKVFKGKPLEIIKEEKEVSEKTQKLLEEAVKSFKKSFR